MNARASNLDDSLPPSGYRNAMALLTDDALPR